MYYACMHAKSLQSCPTLCETMDVAHQAPLSMGFSRQEYWSGLPCLPPGGSSQPRDQTPVSQVYFIGKQVFCFFFFFYHLCHLRSIYINIYIYIHTHIYIIPMLISSIYIYSQLCPLKRPSSNDNPIAANTSVTQSGGGNVQDHHDIFSYQKVF